MASADSEMTVKMGVEFQRFEWKVFRLLDFEELAPILNEFSEQGWDVFDVKIDVNPVVIIRRELSDDHDHRR